MTESFSIAEDVIYCLWTRLHCSIPYVTDFQALRSHKGIQKITKTAHDDSPQPPLSKQESVISSCYAKEKRPDMAVDLQVHRERLIKK